jgi:PKD repeat protein
MISTPLPTTYRWAFGDGDTSYSPHPTHTYTADGVYIVSLLDSSNTTYCHNLRSRRITIEAFPTGITAADSVLCKGDFAWISEFHHFTTAIEYGDGTGESGTIYLDYPHQYLDTGHYTVTMYVTNTFGCIDTLVQPDLIYVEQPINRLLASPMIGCAPMLVNFHDSIVSPTGIAVRTRHWTWTAADTSIVGLGPDTTHIYPEGSYYAYLFDVDTNGCHSFDSVQINSVKPHAYLPRPM